MSEPAKKHDQIPESYTPKELPEIVELAASLPKPPKKKGRKARVIEIQNAHLELLPPLKLIGRRYTNADRVKGGYSAYWAQWHRENLFAPLEALPKAPGVERGCFGFMRCDGNFEEHFEYWIGLVRAPDSPVPAGYESLALPAAPVFVCWLCGREKDGLYGQHERCVERLQAEGYTYYHDAQGYGYHFERYSEERFVDLDSSGRVILDYGLFVEKE